jgi:hypothetical protein
MKKFNPVKFNKKLKKILEWLKTKGVKVDDYFGGLDIYGINDTSLSRSPYADSEGNSTLDLVIKNKKQSSVELSEIYKYLELTDDDKKEYIKFYKQINKEV